MCVFLSGLQTLCSHSGWWNLQWYGEYDCTPTKVTYVQVWQVGLARCNTSETHFFITVTAEVVFHLVAFALALSGVWNLTSAHGGLQALCGEWGLETVTSEGGNVGRVEGSEVSKGIHGSNQGLIVICSEICSLNLRILLINIPVPGLFLTLQLYSQNMTEVAVRMTCKIRSWRENWFTALSADILSSGSSPKIGVFSLKFFFWLFFF